MIVCAAFGDQAGVERLWQTYFRDPTKWSDNRNKKLHPQSPDFMHTSTKESLWIDSWNTPLWMAKALEHTVRLPQRGQPSWGALISQHAKSGNGREALRIYEVLRKDGVEPSSYTFVAALKACCTLHDLESGKKIHADVVESGFELDVYVGTMLVDMYSKFAKLVEARSIFDRMPHRNVVSWNAMILGYAHMEDGEKALHLYAEMQEEEVVPDDHTFVAALKACRSVTALNEGDQVAVNRKYLDKVRAIHLDVLKSGSESAVFVATMLVDAYAKCGSLADARHVFEKMRHRNVVSWTAMIVGYAQVEAGAEALQLYTRMQQEGMIPNDRTFVGALKACSSLVKIKEKASGGWNSRKNQCLEHVREIHVHVVRSGFESDVFVGNMLVDVYAKCGSLMDARRVFDKMPWRDVVSWNTIILGCAQMEEGQEALRLYARMQQEGVVPNDRTFVGALKACISLVTAEETNSGDAKLMMNECLEQVRVIHSDILIRDFGSDVFVGNMLVDVYARCGSLVDARQVFENMPSRNVVAWNAMILGCAVMEEGEVALDLYARMQQEGVIPNERTFVSVLKACSSLAALPEGSDLEGTCMKTQCLEQVRAIHSHIGKSGYQSSVFVGTMLVDVYAKSGSLMDARCVFDNMPNHDVVSWTAMISAYAQMKEGEQALDLFAQMQNKGVVPDDRTFVAALKACSGLVDLVNSNKDDRNRLKDFCLERVRVIHRGVDESRFGYDMFVGNMLVDVYAKCGCLVDARHVFEKMPHRNVVSWTAIILGYALGGEGEVALKLYTRMHQEGVIPDTLAFVSALKACATVAGLEKGREIHAEILGSGLGVSDPFLASSLIDMYSKCGSMVDAQQVFEASDTNDIVTWNALIAGYSHQGEGRLVLDLFEKMIQGEMQPTAITFLSVLAVCRHVGLVNEGQKYFDAMTTDFGITPWMEHYTCMIDLFGRAGQVDNAMLLAKTMPFQPDRVVWQTLLGACQKWNNLEIGKQAFEYAVRLDNNDAAAYVTMANIYANACMWEDAKAMQAMRVNIQAWKQEGQSWWTDNQGDVHAFSVGDQEDAERQHIHVKLQ